MGDLSELQASSPSELVNRTLHQARLLIEASEQANSEALCKALLTSSVSALFFAYQAVLGELVAATNIPNVTVEGRAVEHEGRFSGLIASDWQMRLQGVGHVSPEINRCVELERGMEKGWLAELLDCFQRLHTVTAKKQPSSMTSPTHSAPKQENRIAVTHLEGHDEGGRLGGVGVSTLLFWLQMLKDLVQQFRADLAEW